VNPAPERQTIIRKPLLTALLDSVKTTKRIEIKQIDFAPSQATGLHNHPCPVVGYIARGSVNFQVEGEPPKTLHEGDALRRQSRDVGRTASSGLTASASTSP